MICARKIWDITSAAVLHARINKEVVCRTMTTIIFFRVVWPFCPHVPWTPLLNHTMLVGPNKKKEKRKLAKAHIRFNERSFGLTQCTMCRYASEGNARGNLRRLKIKNNLHNCSLCTRDELYTYLYCLWLNDKRNSESLSNYFTSQQIRLKARRVSAAPNTAYRERKFFRSEYTEMFCRVQFFQTPN